MNVVKTDVPFASLNASDIRPVQISAVSKLFLTEPSGSPRGPHTVAERGALGALLISGRR